MTQEHRERLAEAIGAIDAVAALLRESEADKMANLLEREAEALSEILEEEEND